VSTPLKCSGTARVLKGSYSFTCTPRVHPLMEWTIPALPSQPKLVLIYQPWRDGRLSWPWVAGWLHTEISVQHQELNPDTVAHLSSNRAQRRLTSLIEDNTLTTTPDHQPKTVRNACNFSTTQHYWEHKSRDRPKTGFTFSAVNENGTENDFSFWARNRNETKNQPSFSAENERTYDNHFNKFVHLQSSETLS